MSVLFLIFGVVLIGQAIGATWPEPEGAHGAGDGTPLPGG
jgi:hypothetical protein